MKNRFTMLGLSLLTLLTASSTLSCGHKAESFETKAKLIRTYVNRKDEAGNPVVTDVEVQFTTCPGDIRKIIRGGGTFAKCITDKKPGEEMSATMHHSLQRSGHYRATVVSLGGCERTPDPTDTRSYDSLRICKELKTDGILVGFHCEIGSSEELVKACPFFGQ